MSGELIFERLSERVARYSSRGGEGALRFQVVGYASAELRGPAGVLFELENRSSDDGLEIEPGPAAGASIGTEKASGALDARLAVWLGQRVEELAPQLGALPAGEYLLVRTSRLPMRVSQLTLGNELQAVGPNVQLFCKDERLTAAVVGPDVRAAPGLDGLLVGFAFLDAFGGGRHDDLVFFSRTSAAEGGARQHDEVVVAIPVTGELVTSPWWTPRAADLERWAASGAMLAAERLIAPAPPPPAPPVLRFKPRSPRAAKLTVTRADAGVFGLTSRGRRWHELGLRDSPLFGLEGAASEHTVRRLPRGLALGELPEPDWDFAGPFLEWAEGSRVLHGLSLFASLPAGQYLVVRVPVRRAAEADGVARLVAEGGRSWPVWAAGGEVPDLSQPLLGVPVIVDEDDEAPARVTFFACVEPRGGEHDAGDCVLVVPVRGELVAGSERERALARWAEQGVAALAADLGAHP